MNGELKVWGSQEQAASESSQRVTSVFTAEVQITAVLRSGEQHQEIRLPAEPRTPKALKGILRVLRPHHQELLQVFKSEE